MSEPEQWLYIGPDQIHGCIYLQHGVHYGLVKTNTPKRGRKKPPYTVSVRANGQATSLAYENESEFQKYWTK